MQGALVPLKDAVTAFEEILDGKHDALPEAAFYMVGGIEDVKVRRKQKKECMLTVPDQGPEDSRGLVEVSDVPQREERVITS
jgi:hypothetical protein